MKQKQAKKEAIYTPAKYDACHTPAYAIEPLLPFLPKMNLTIWESACGGDMMCDALVNALPDARVFGSDLLDGMDFFKEDLLSDVGYRAGDTFMIITNPPFSLKYKWLARCYDLGYPFALLLPVETIGAKTAQKLFSQYGAEFIFMDSRIDFKMPNKGFAGTSQFPTMWVCSGVLPQPIVYSSITESKKRFNARLKSAVPENRHSV